MLTISDNNVIYKQFESWKDKTIYTQFKKHINKVAMSTNVKILTINNLFSLNWSSRLGGSNNYF